MYMMIVMLDGGYTHLRLINQIVFTAASYALKRIIICIHSHKYILTVAKSAHGSFKNSSSLLTKV